MKVAGNVIKTQRNRYGLSQKALAQGICAQASISLIESQNNCPNLKILHPLCDRLNLKLSSVIEVNQKLQDVEETILKQDFYRAKRIFKRLSLRSFKRHHRLGCYFCYQGFFALKNLDYFNALYFFNKSLNVSYPDLIYQGWSYLGLGIVYFKRHDANKALEFLELADKELNLATSRRSENQFKLFIKSRLKISLLLSRLRWYQKANTVNFKTILILVKSHSMYQLVDVYKQLNQNYVKLNRVHQARLALKRMQVFNYLYKSPGSLRE